MALFKRNQIEEAISRAVVPTNGIPPGDLLNRLKRLLDTYADKGLELVCVNLDDTAEQATAFLERRPVPGGFARVWLFQQQRCFDRQSRRASNAARGRR